MATYPGQQLGITQRDTGQEDNMSVSVRTIISAAHRMGATVFKIQQRLLQVQRPIPPGQPADDTGIWEVKTPINILIV